MTCEKCIFWMKYSNRKHLGQCRKYTPELFYPSSGSFFWFSGEQKTGWPETKDDQWCGEFEECNK